MSHYILKLSSRREAARVFANKIASVVRKTRTHGNDEKKTRVALSNAESVSQFLGNSRLQVLIRRHNVTLVLMVWLMFSQGHLTGWSYVCSFSLFGCVCVCAMHSNWFGSNSFCVCMRWVICDVLIWFFMIFLLYILSFSRFAWFLCYNANMLSALELISDEN